MIIRLCHIAPANCFPLLCQFLSCASCILFCYSPCCLCSRSRFTCVSLSHLPVCLSSLSRPPSVPDRQENFNGCSVYPCCGSGAEATISTGASSQQCCGVSSYTYRSSVSSRASSPLQAYCFLRGLWRLHCFPHAVSTPFQAPGSCFSLRSSQGRVYYLPPGSGRGFGHSRMELQFCHLQFSGPVHQIIHPDPVDPVRLTLDFDLSHKGEIHLSH